MDNPCLITDIYKAVSGDDIVTRIEVIEFINTKGVYDILDVDKAFPGKTLEVETTSYSIKIARDKSKRLADCSLRHIRVTTRPIHLFRIRMIQLFLTIRTSILQKMLTTEKEFTHRSGKIYNREGNIFAIQRVIIWMQ